MSIVSYVRDPLQECEAGIAACKRELTVLEEQRKQWQRTGRYYEASKTELRSLIAQITLRSSGDVYRIRAQVASRLCTLLVSLTLAPAGGAPVASWDTAVPVPSGLPAGADLAIGEDPREGRYFMVDLTPFKPAEIDDPDWPPTRPLR
jgi:hypothetical protein